jgi:site-specific DNA recombinase
VMRDLYRGRLVYGRTRWERRKGTKRKVDTPPSEWITVEVPALRIVPEDLWQAAHDRLAATRAVYARLTDGRLYGRPEGHVESPYLFTGFLRCQPCGGAVNVSKQPSRGVPMIYYVCATHRTRGAAVCRTGIRARLEPLEAAILAKLERAVLTEDVLIPVVERTAARYAETVSRAQDHRGRIEEELHAVRTRIARYVQALGGGVALDEIKAELATLKAREHLLTAQLDQLATPAAPALDRGALRRRLLEWHDLLRQGPQVARQLLRKLLPEPIVLEPTAEGVHFRGRAAWAAILSGGIRHVGLVVPPG